MPAVPSASQQASPARLPYSLAVQASLVLAHTAVKDYILMQVGVGSLHRSTTHTGRIPHMRSAVFCWQPHIRTRQPSFHCVWPSDLLPTFLLSAVLPGT